LFQVIYVNWSCNYNLSITPHGKRNRAIACKSAHVIHVIRYVIFVPQVVANSHNTVECTNWLFSECSWVAIGNVAPMKGQLGRYINNYNKAVQSRYIDMLSNDTVPNRTLLQPITKLYLFTIELKLQLRDDFRCFR